MTRGKRTWRRREHTDDAIRDALRQSKSIAAAARRLGVNKSSLSRWLKDDPALHPSPPAATSTGSETPAAIVASENMDAGQWKRWVLATYNLNATEMQLLALAVEALAMTRDKLLRPADRLAAAARFQSVLRQLQLPDPEVNQHGEAEKPESERPSLYRVK